jgi:hypothetical protein
MIIKGPNQVGGLPRFSGTSRKLMNRNVWLSGQKPCYYAGNQTPDVGEPGLYHPPPDWPKAGQLLKLPQQVWLYACHPAANLLLSRNIAPMATGPIRDGDAPFFSQDPQIWFMNYYADGRIAALVYVLASTDTSGPYSNDLIAFTRDATLDPVGGTGPHHAYWGVIGALTRQANFSASGIIDPSFVERINDPYLAEYSRLTAIYAQVKSTIEALRPHRTYINYLNPWDYTQSLTNVPGTYFGAPYNVRFSTSGPRQFYFLPNQPVLYWPMLTPSDTNPYLGTDFLMIYAGSPDTTEILINDAVAQAQQLNAARPRSLSTVAGAVSKFRRYGYRYYGLDVPMPKFNNWSNPLSLPPQFNITIPSVGPSPVFPTKAQADADTTDAAECYWFPTQNSGTGFSDMTASATIINQSIQAYVDQLNALNQRVLTVGPLQLQTDANTLSPLGVDAQYMGGSSTITSANDLIKTIAAFYGFDPSTGIDL